MKKYALTIDTRILELLGPNLYTNIYYVLAELIANSYDADAKNVYIIIKDDQIRVEDDGHGMSYKNGDIKKYLNVAAVSRTSDRDSLTKSKTRRKMGRKGVGKLAALSVSNEVDVMTTAKGEKSGFILSRRPVRGRQLKPIKDSEIVFEKIGRHGSAIVMRNPQYSLHKTLGSIRRNLLKIFPLVGEDFQIHLVMGNKSLVIREFDRSIASELCALICLGEKFAPLCDLVPDQFPDRRKELVEPRAAWKREVRMTNNFGQSKDYIVEMQGWLGAYKSTRGRKAEATDFPDNFISLFANEKLGEFNILPGIGQNKLNEVYVVGQLHVDLFELSELPDMALSNRQGYKSDDLRYIAVRDAIREDLLPDILKKRDVFADLVSAAKEKAKEEEQRQSEAALKAAIETFRKNASAQAANELRKLSTDATREMVESVIANAINEHAPDLGLKTVVDAQKKRLLISQTIGDKSFSDVVFQMLVFNNVPEEQILYTNCDAQICRVPDGRRVYEYLREFFVESYSAQKIFVVFITSENTKVSWGAVTEVGASWITQVDHRIFNIPPFRPEHPLDDELQWQSTNRSEPTRGDLWMTPLNADIFCEKIESISAILGYSKKSRSQNAAHLDTLVTIRN